MKQLFDLLFQFGLLFSVLAAEITLINMDSWIYILYGNVCFPKQMGLSLRDYAALL